MEPVNQTWHTAADSLKNDYRNSEQQWTGQRSEEPLSGVQGRGTATDPYDAGNRPEQLGAPQTQANTALVPEALSSTAADRSSNLKSSNAASGPAALQPELNPFGETADKYSSQPLSQSRVPEQRDARAELERQTRLSIGHETAAPRHGPSMTGAVGAGATGAATGSGYEKYTGGHGGPTSAQTSALGSDTPPTGLRHTSQKPGLGHSSDPTRTSDLGRDTNLGHASGLGHTSDLGHSSNLGQTSGLGHSTSAQKSALQDDDHTTGLRQSASTQEPGLERDSLSSGLGQTTSSHKPNVEKDSQALGLEGSRNLDSTTRSGNQSRPDRTSHSAGTETRNLSSGVAGTTNRDPTSEQRGHGTTEGQSSPPKAATGGRDGGDPAEVGFQPKTDHVSKEALRGPSVAEPREGWKKDGEAAKAEGDKQATDPTGSQPGATGAGTSEKEHHSEGKHSSEGKHASDEKHSKQGSHGGGTLSHIKEKVEKVIHPHKS
ncbi:hypothetical protein BBP40_011632 [Aspergillus hancockii]|nr:hypothetical protein BBP40_011632 [Aspergillus hancockii]